MNCNIRESSDHSLRAKLALCVAIPCVAALYEPAHAQTWIGAGGNNWSTPGNWNAAVPVSGAANLSVTFGGTTGLTPNQNIANPIVLQTVVFANTASSPFNISGNQIRFDNLGAAPSLVNGSAANHTMSTPIDLATTTTVNTNTGNLSLTNVISGAGGVIKTGGGTLTLAMGNTYTGGTMVGAGTLQIDLGTTPGSISGDITNNAALLFNGSFQPQTVTYNGVISGNGSLTKLGATYLILAANNTYTGETRISGGVLQIGLSGGTGGSVAGNITNDNGFFFIDAVGSVLGNVTNNRVFRMTGGAVAGNITNNNSFTMDGGAVAGNITNNAALFFSRSDSYHYAGAIVGTGSLSTGGSGTIVLSGANAYTGSTTVTAGVLQFKNQVSLYNNNIASWTAGNLTVRSGAAAVFSVGGGGEFTSTDIDTLKGLGTATGGFTSGSTLALDSTNASGGNFAYGSNIGNPNGGANMLQLEKLGGNTLTLTGANTYTGGTIVRQGVLNLGSDTAVGSGSLTVIGAGLQATGIRAVGNPLQFAQSVSFVGNGTMTFTNTAAKALVGTSLVHDSTGVTDIAGTFTANASSSVTVNAGELRLGNAAGVGGGFSVSGPVVLNGGTLTLRSLGFSAFPTLVLNGGVLNVTGGYSLPLNGILQGSGGVSSRVVTANGSTIIATGPLSLGGTNHTNGVTMEGDLFTGANAVTLNSLAPATLGAITTLNNGTIAAANGVFVGGGRVVTGAGTISGRVATANGSIIEAVGTLTLGDPASPIGFAAAGELRTGANTVTLLDSNQAALGALTTLGTGVADGTLTAAKGLYVDFADNITGRGVIDTPNLLVKALTNNGTINGNSILNPITINGYAKGIGQYSNVVFNGTYSPGLSPAAVVSLGDLMMGSGSVLEMELAGLQPGTQYDTLDIAGTATIAGDIVVRGLNGFIPLPGKQFDMLSFGSLVGDPDVLNGTEFAGLWFDVLREANSLSIRPRAIDGDASLDGVVDLDDFTRLAPAFGMISTWTSGDFNYDGVTDLDDFTTLALNFGRSLPAEVARGSSVPEPAASLLALACIGRRRRQVERRAIEADRMVNRTRTLSSAAWPSAS